MCVCVFIYTYNKYVTVSLYSVNIVYLLLFQLNLFINLQNFLLNINVHVQCYLFCINLTYASKG